MSAINRRRFLNRHVAVPLEHGAWIWWIGPLLIGLAAGGRPGPATLWTVLGAAAAFLIRQPITLTVKTWAGRGSKRVLAPALGWIGVYAGLGALAAGALVGMGYRHVLWLAVPAVPMFVWYLAWLVRRPGQRRQIGLELLGSGVLALAAPAAYWTAGGAGTLAAWTLWGVCWLQSAGSILHVYLRLAQRGLDHAPSPAARLRMGAGSLGFHAAALVVAGGLAAAGVVPPLVALAFAALAGYALFGTLQPALAARPQRIGVQQLAASALFVLLAALAYGLG